jgi:hypothetical protein
MNIRLVLGIVMITITLGATTTVLTPQSSFAATSRAALPASSATSGVPFKIVDISTPNVVKTRNGDIIVSMPTEDYEKKLNTLTKITSYSGKSSLYINGERFFDVNMKAVLLLA